MFVRVPARRRSVYSALSAASHVTTVLRSQPASQHVAVRCVWHAGYENEKDANTLSQDIQETVSKIKRLRDELNTAEMNLARLLEKYEVLAGEPYEGAGKKEAPKKTDDAKGYILTPPS